MKDTFHAYLVRGAKFAGTEEMPIVGSCTIVPERLVPFSKAMKNGGNVGGICCYEPDVNFEGLWTQPRAYLSRLMLAKPFIGPDYSIYRDMPLVMQKWNCYRNKALTFWLQKNGVPVIPNASVGDRRTWDFCLDGLPLRSVLAVGTYGCIQGEKNLRYMVEGVSEMIRRLIPELVIIYGAVPDELVWVLQTNGVPYKDFPGRLDEFSQQNRRRRDPTPYLSFAEPLVKGGE